MGVDTPEPPKPYQSTPVPWKGRNDNPLMVSYDDIFNRALAIDQNSHLPFDLMGNLGEISGYFGVDDLPWRDLSSIYTL
jgi:hypothetical protein